MANTKCGACGHRYFELETKSIKKSDFKYSFVQCQNCGVPVGVMDFANIGVNLNNLRSEFCSKEDGEEIKRNLESINQNLRTIMNFLNKK